MCTQRKSLPRLSRSFIELNLTLGHAHFKGKLFVRPLGSPHTKPRTKFEVSSSSSFGDIDAAMVDLTLLERPLNKGQGHSFWYQSILIYDFL